MSYKKPTIKVTSTSEPAITPRTCGSNTFNCNRFDCGNKYDCSSKF